MGTEIPYMGSKISLISKAEIRYEGILYSIDAEESTVALSQVRSFGTEDRQTEHPVQAREEVFEYIIFRGSDIKDLHVCDTSKLNPPAPTDPAIVESSMSSNNQVSSSQQQQLPNNNPPPTTPGQQQQGNNYMYMSPNSQQYPPSQHHPPSQSQQQQQHMQQQQQQQPYPMYNTFGQNYLQFSANQSTHSGSRTPSPGSSHHQHQQQHNHRPQHPSTPGMNHPGYMQSPPGEGRGGAGGGMRGVYNRGGARFPNYSQAVTASNQHLQEFSRSEGPAQQQQQQQQHYFNKDSEHNLPTNRFPGENTQFNQGPARPQGPPFNNHHNNYDFRFNRGRPPNRGYYGGMGRGSRGGMGRGGPPRGYMGGGRGSFARGAGRPGSLKFDSEFDFESSNAQFDKLQIEKELKEKLNIGGKDLTTTTTTDDSSTDPPSSTTTTTRGGELLNGGEVDASVVVSSSDANCYDKTKSFFDSISCEALDRNGNRGGGHRRTNWKEERKLNFETFGLRGSNNYNHRYRGRSRGGYYNNQGRNGYGGGGGQDGGGGGYFNRNQAPPFNRPGERSWGNQQRGYRGKYNNWPNPTGNKYDNNNPYNNNYNNNNSNNSNNKDSNSVESNAVNNKK